VLRLPVSSPIPVHISALLTDAFFYHIVVLYISHYIAGLAVATQCAYGTCQLRPTSSHPSNPTPNGSNPMSFTFGGSEVESALGNSLGGGIFSCLIWDVESDCPSEGIMSGAREVRDDESEVRVTAGGICHGDDASRNGMGFEDSKPDTSGDSSLTCEDNEVDVNSWTNCSSPVDGFRSGPRVAILLVDHGSSKSSGW